MANNGKKICEEPEKQKEEQGVFRDMLSRITQSENDAVSTAVIVKESFELAKELVSQEERSVTKQAEIIVNAIEKQINKLMPEKYYEVEMQKAQLQNMLEMEKLNFEKEREAYRTAEKLILEPMRTEQVLSELGGRIYQHKVHVETGLLGLEFKSTKKIADLQTQVCLLQIEKRLDERQRKNAAIIFSRGNSLIEGNTNSKINKLTNLMIDFFESSRREDKKRKKT